MVSGSVVAHDVADNTRVTVEYDGDDVLLSLFSETRFVGGITLDSPDAERLGKTLLAFSRGEVPRG